MKTIIIIVILAIAVLYSLKSIVKHFKGEGGCCGCASKNGGTCNCAHKKQDQ